MAIKNFIVITEKVDEKHSGVSWFLNYLEDKKRHDAEKILNFTDNKNDFFKNSTLNACCLDDQNKILGGRPVASYAQSFNFSLPPGVFFTDEKLKELNDILIEEIKNVVKNLDTNDIYSNAHIKNMSKPNKNTSQAHINLLVSKVSFDKNKKLYVSNRAINQNFLLNRLKNKFTKFVVENSDINNINYNSKQPKVNKPLWQAREDIKINNELLTHINQKTTLNNTFLETKNNSLNKELKENTQLNIKIKNEIEQNKIIIQNNTETITKQNTKIKNLKIEIDTKSSQGNKILNDIKNEIANQKNILNTEKEKYFNFSILNIAQKIGISIKTYKEKYLESQKKQDEITNNFQRQIDKLHKNEGELKQKLETKIINTNTETLKQIENLKKDLETEKEISTELAKILYKKDPTLLEKFKERFKFN